MRRTYLTGVLVLAALTSCRSGESEKGEAEEAAEGAAVQAPVTPGQPVAITEDTAGLFAKAAIQPEQARATALATVPGGTITKGELEEEDGKLIYSFDVTVPGQSGITEVHVDAQTGAVIKTEHEGESTEAAGREKAN